VSREARADEIAARVGEADARRTEAACEANELLASLADAVRRGRSLLWVVTRFRGRGADDIDAALRGAWAATTSLWAMYRLLRSAGRTAEADALHRGFLAVRRGFIPGPRHPHDAGDCRRCADEVRRRGVAPEPPTFAEILMGRKV
jgi:hypothetical protein